MRDRIRGDAYARVMSTVAVFLALGGVAYAIGRNDVKAKHIATGAVRSAEIKDGKVRAKDLANGVLPSQPFSLHFDEVAGSDLFEGTTFGDPPTPGPAVQVTVPESAIVSISIQVGFHGSDPGCEAQVFAEPDMGFGELAHVSYDGNPTTVTDIRRDHTLIPPGTYEFKLQYRAPGDENFCLVANRKLWVEVVAP